MDEIERKRRPFQKVLMGIAILSYLAAVGCALAVAFSDMDNANDPVAASLMASAVFFIGVGIVLQAIGTVSLPDLTIEKSAAFGI